jgi:serine/threonine-protein kinase
MSRDRGVVEKVITSLRNIGEFQLSPLRQSADGATFKAADAGRRIAISIRTIWPKSQEFSQRLAAHARAAQPIDHGNLAKVIGSGDLDRAFFIVSSFIDGLSLRQNLLTGDRPNTWDLIDFARQACTGVEWLHSRGLVHHALHPDNIVFQFDGTARLLDIGFFRENSPVNTPFFSTAVYLAPEQLAGRPADQATNFYSVAIMLYEIATGKLPYNGDNWDELSSNSQGKIAEPIELNSELPRGVNAAIVKALSLDRAARYASGPEFVRALEDYKSFDKPAVVTVPPMARAAAAPVQFARSAPSFGLETESMGGAWDPPPAISVKPVAVVEPPPPPPVEVPEPEPEPPQPSKIDVAKEAALRTAKQLATQAHRTAKKMNPWAVGLALLIFILFGFLIRTIVFSFSGAPSTAQVPASSVADTKPETNVPAPDPTPVVAVEPAVPEKQFQEVVTKHARKLPKAPKAAAQPAVAVAIVQPSSDPNAFSPYFGSVIVQTNPAGVRVVVDGKSNLAFTSPLVISLLSPGTHVLEFSKDGYNAVTRSVEITAGARSAVQVQLAVPAATLAVASNPSGAYILIDGANTNRVTPAQVAVPPGSHTLTLRKLGYLEVSEQLTLQSGEQQSRNVSLLLAGSTPDIRVAQTGGIRKLFGNKVTGVRVTVRSNPAGATVSINGQTVPRNTPVDFGLNPGNYAMEIHLDGYQTVHKTITVETGKPLSFDESLHP